MMTTDTITNNPAAPTTRMSDEDVTQALKETEAIRSGHFK
jgi:hypothetical protein